MQVGQSIGLIPHFIKLTVVQNTGAAFGVFAGRQPVFVVTSLLVLVVIAIYWRRARPAQWPVVIALAMIAGGAFGNLIDRALVGHVTDFFEFAFFDFPVFNVADIGIVGGVGVLMVWILFGPELAAPALAGDSDVTTEAADQAAVGSADAPDAPVESCERADVVDDPAGAGMDVADDPETPLGETAPGPHPEGSRP
jgi:signal peptidase II